MEVHFPAELKARLVRAAAENSSQVEVYVRQLVEQYVDHDVWFREQARRGFADLDRGEFVTPAEVGSRLEKLLRS